MRTGDADAPGVDRWVVEEARVAASAEVVYDLISDITRMGRWSPETVSCRWLRGADPGTVGARFRGHNRAGWRRWSTTCTVTAAERGRRFRFDVAAGPFPIATWSYEMAADGHGGTIVRETWRDRRAAWLTALTDRALVPNRPVHNRAGMRATLSALRAAAERDEERR